MRRWGIRRISCLRRWEGEAGEASLSFEFQQKTPRRLIRRGAFCVLVEDKKLKWTGPGLNRRHQDFQSCALPTELPVRGLQSGVSPLFLRETRRLGKRLFLTAAGGDFKRLEKRKRLGRLELRKCAGFTEFNRKWRVFRAGSPIAHAPHIVEMNPVDNRG